jgi:hypothetical protein
MSAVLLEPVQVACAHREAKAVYRSVWMISLHIAVLLPVGGAGLDWVQGITCATLLAAPAVGSVISNQMIDQVVLHSWPALSAAMLTAAVCGVAWTFTVACKPAHANSNITLQLLLAYLQKKAPMCLSTQMPIQHKTLGVVLHKVCIKLQYLICLDRQDTYSMRPVG